MKNKFLLLPNIIYIIGYKGDIVMHNKEDLVFQLVNNEYIQPAFSNAVNLEKFQKIPIHEIAMFGTAFLPVVNFMASSDKAYAEVLKKVGNDTPLYVAQDKAGNVIKLATSVKGETDGRKIGSLMKNGVVAGQARFKEVSISELTQNSFVIDPMTMMVAAELIYVAKEIDVIKQQQQDFFKYLLAEKQSKLEGNISFLIKVLNDFKYNFQNQTYRISVYTKVLDIKQEAEQAILSSQKHIEYFLNKGKENYDKLGNELQNYQISLYSYALASFVEIIVLKNLNKTYLDKILKRIETFSIEYRETYTDCYNYLESTAERNLQSVIIDTVSKIGKKIGNTIAKTSVGDKTLINEKIIQSANKTKELKDNKIKKQLLEFSNYKDTRVSSFQQLIDSINKIYNENQVYFTSENIYIPMLL